MKFQVEHQCSSSISCPFLCRTPFIRSYPFNVRHELEPCWFIPSLPICQNWSNTKCYTLYSATSKIYSKRHLWPNSPVTTFQFDAKAKNIKNNRLQMHKQSYSLLSGWSFNRPKPTQRPIVHPFDSKNNIKRNDKKAKIKGDKRHTTQNARNALIVISRLLNRHLKAKGRVPVYSRALLLYHLTESLSSGRWWVWGSEEGCWKEIISQRGFNHIFANPIWLFIWNDQFHKLISVVLQELTNNNRQMVSYNRPNLRGT